MTNLPLRWNAYYNVGRRILLYTEYKAKKICLPNNVKEMQYIIHGSAQEYMHAPHTYIHTYTFWVYMGCDTNLR